MCGHHNLRIGMCNLEIIKQCFLDIKVVVCSVIRIASPDRKVLNDRLQRECQNVVCRDKASVRGAPAGAAQKWGRLHAVGAHPGAAALLFQRRHGITLLLLDV